MCQSELWIRISTIIFSTFAASCVRQLCLILRRRPWTHRQLAVGTGIRTFAAPWVAEAEAWSAPELTNHMRPHFLSVRRAPPLLSPPPSLLWMDRTFLIFLDLNSGGTPRRTETSRRHDGFPQLMIRSKGTTGSFYPVLLPTLNVFYFNLV